ncbi:hypothetical protein LJ737_24900 [Hymenobacter sp. 15J16-1T3B]|uniref:hypothetical protein n=1 Tax=Hymenobacter sp. 15J16-1T3B TaxID=2886941 RepID=UPI001D12B6BA|nr:hypothetical protein [Hymenobacter sp. 15J16-1T3B]MCC3160499.1 hypothetical protein [Hymenobacter sp. 15J16-1T3B]
MKRILTQGFGAALCALLAAPLGLQAQTWQWLTTQPRTGGTSQITASALDASGNIVVAGTISGTVVLGTTLLTSAGGQDLFVGRLSPSGTWLQAASAGGAASDYPTKVAVDNMGNIVVTGRFASPTLDFGTAFTLTNAGPSTTNDIFVACLNAAGQWTQAIGVGGPGNDEPRGLALDAAGRATVAGFFLSPTLTLGSLTLTNASAAGLSADIFVARLSAAGQWTEAVRAGGIDHDNILDLVQDAAGTAYVAGIFTSASVAFGPTTLTNADASRVTFDAFVAKLTLGGAAGTGGTWTQAVRAGGAQSNDQFNALAVDGNGNVVVTGLYQGGASTIGTTTLSAPAPGVNYDPLVARLSAGGTWTQAVRATSSSLCYPTTVALDTDGNATIAGQLAGPTAQFGTVALDHPNSTGVDVFVARLSTAGVWTYGVRAGGNATDGANNVILTGTSAIVSGFIGATASGPFGFGSLPVDASSTTCFVGRLGGLVNATTGPRVREPLSLAPNPARELVRLHLGAAAGPEVVVTDALGRPVRRVAVPAHASTAMLDVRGLPAGVYGVRCGAAGGRLVVE